MLLREYVPGARSKEFLNEQVNVCRWIKKDEKRRWILEFGTEVLPLPMELYLLLLRFAGRFAVSLWLI
jgi:hypothetical protein